jgi:hypothetical protein
MAQTSAVFLLCPDSGFHTVLPSYPAQTREVPHCSSSSSPPFHSHPVRPQADSEDLKKPPSGL